MDEKSISVNSSCRSLLCFVLVGVFIAVPGIGTAKPPWSISIDSSKSGIHQVQLRGFEESEWKLLQKQSPAQLESRFRVYVTDDHRSIGTTPVLGTVKLGIDGIGFLPRFPWIAGTEYVAHYHRCEQGDIKMEEPLRIHFEIASEPQQPAARVLAVYPTASRLPQNLLKFYIDFSAPMAKGDVYRWIELSKESGEALEHPFLEIAEELWDRSGTRLTLLLDPGRVKRGLVPREEDGPVLEVGQAYRLTIRNAWKDASGQPLSHQYVKLFQVEKDDVVQPNPDHWQLNVQQEAQTTEIKLECDESLDFALLMRAVSVLDGQGKPIEGQIVLEDQERSWRWRRSPALIQGTYQLRIESILEDLCGNSIERPFEVDSSNANQQRSQPMLIRKFEIR